MDFYVKVKKCCNNCKYECGIQLDPKEAPRLYCNKNGYSKEKLPDELTCEDFVFDANIIRPSVDTNDIMYVSKSGDLE